MWFKPLLLRIALPLVVILVYVPLILGKVTPNHWYAFRTPKTMSSPEIWCQTNKLRGMYFFITGWV
jgi:uncharacterized membrane protein